ncbi:MAG: hypothetical protein ABL308_07985 [Oceanicaulis sp.]
MTAFSPTSAFAAIDPGAAAADPAVRRRAAAYGAAILLHGLLFAGLLAAPAAVREEAGRMARAIEVRFYTVAGGEGAETDAPLFEPPLAQSAEAGEGAQDGETERPSGADPAADEAQAGGAEAAEVQEAAEDAEPADAPEPVAETAVETEEAAAEPAPAETGDAVLFAPAATPEPAGESADAPSAGAAAGPAPAPAAPADPDRPMATSQLSDLPPPGARRAGPPSFADILARARTRLDPADFEVANLAGGVRLTTREVFCLSSASGNRDAMDCGDAPNAASAELAKYGLMDLGEEPPDFLEDLTRLEYQLQTLGANDNAVARILTALREARREAIATDPIQRQMTRDGEGYDNLGVRRRDEGAPGRGPAGGG